MFLSRTYLTLFLRTSHMSEREEVEKLTVEVTWRRLGSRGNGEEDNGEED